MSEIGVESTVIRVMEGKIHILRPGKITKEELSRFAEVVINVHILAKVEEKEAVLSPGMKYKHYAPKTKCVLVYSEKEDTLISMINALAKENPNCVILGRKQNMGKYEAKDKLSMGGNFEEISKNLFTILRKIDSYQADLVIIEGVESKGLGLAIMNRLLRACSYEYKEK